MPKQTYPWTDETMKLAITEVKLGSSICSVATRYNIPVSTLSDRIRGSREKQGSPGRKTGRTWPWTQEVMAQAVAEVKEGECVRQVAARHGIPPSTLHDRFEKKDTSQIDPTNGIASEQKSATDLPKRHRVSSARYKTWNPELMELAVAEVKQGHFVKRVALKYGIPQTTLRDRLAREKKQLSKQGSLKGNESNSATLSTGAENTTSSEGTQLNLICEPDDPTDFPTTKAGQDRGGSDELRAVQSFTNFADRYLLITGRNVASKSHTCDVCQLSFALQRSLEGHQILEHGGPSVLTCLVCGMQFSFMESYSVHMQFHREARSSNSRQKEQNFQSCDSALEDEDLDDGFKEDSPDASATDDYYVDCEGAQKAANQLLAGNDPYPRKLTLKVENVEGPETTDPPDSKGDLPSDEEYKDLDLTISYNPEAGSNKSLTEVSAQNGVASDDGYTNSNTPPWASYFSYTYNNAEIIPSVDDPMFKEFASTKTALQLMPFVQKGTSRRFKCPLCPYEWHFLSKIRSHMYLHTGERHYRCNICDKTFATASRRSNHITMKHTTDPSQRSHLCNVCGKKYTSSTMAKYHERTVHGEKHLQCPHCPYKSASAWTMKVHQRQHTGEKPCVCEHCGEAFTVNVSLRTHLRSKHGIIVTSDWQRPPTDPNDADIPKIGRPKKKK